MSEKDKLFFYTGIAFLIAFSLGMILGAYITSKNYAFYSALDDSDYIILQLQKRVDSLNIELGKLTELIEENFGEVEAIILYNKEIGNRVRVDLELKPRFSAED